MDDFGHVYIPHDSKCVDFFFLFITFPARMDGRKFLTYNIIHILYLIYLCFLNFLLGFHFCVYFLNN